MGESARNNPEWPIVDGLKFTVLKMARKATEVCLQVLKESNKNRFHSFSVRNSVFTILIFSLGVIACTFFSDNLSRKAKAKSM